MQQQRLPPEILPSVARTDAQRHQDRLARAERRRLDRQAAKRARRPEAVTTAEVIQLEITGPTRERFRALVREAMSLTPPAPKRAVALALFEAGLKVVEDMLVKQAEAGAGESLVQLAAPGAIGAIDRKRARSGAGVLLGGR